MKKLTFLLLSLLCVFSGHAQTASTVRANLDHATVFFTGAELTHTARANVARGANEIIIEGLSPDIDINSLKVKVSGGVIISAYEFSKDYLSTVKDNSPLVRKLTDSLEYYNDEINKVRRSVSVSSNMSQLLQDAIDKNVSGSEEGLDIDDLVKTMEYYKTQSIQLYEERLQLTKREKKLTDHRNSINNQLREYNSDASVVSGVLRLSFTSPSAQNASFTVTYNTPTASWEPYYDINITSTDKPVSITWKAKVRQTTGLDWEKVTLTLSSAAPSGGKVAPLFNAWFLREQPQYPSVSRPAEGRSAKVSAQNSYSYDYDMVEESVITGAMAMRRNTPETLYIVDGIPYSEDDFAAIDRNQIKDISIMSSSDAAVYGSSGSGSVFVVTLKSMADYISQKEDMLTLSYNIDLPYSVPGNGKYQNIELQTKQATASYKYYSVPKLDSETYLLAEMGGWESLGLMSGRANITYDGTYLGETFIDAGSTNSNLALTLGTESRVAVKRELVSDFSSTRTVGSDITQVFTYRITVRNNLNKQARIVVKDQYPISTQKNIEVTLRKETTPWTANVEELGVISWEEDFAAGETRVYEISYSVKYPKTVTLNL